MDICQELNLKADALRNKLSGKTRFTLEQAVKIQETWFSDIPVNELFRHE